MFYEYAFIPDVFGPTVIDDRGLFVILDQLLAGVIENGMIANLNKDKLVRYVRQVLLPAVRDPNARAQIIDRLELLDNRHRLVRHPASASGNPTRDDDWLALAMDSHARVPFDAVFLCQGLLKRCELTDAALVDMSTALASAHWQGRKRSMSVRMVESDLRGALRPILRHSRAVSLIDPYLSPTNARYWRTVSLVAQLAGFRGHGQQLEARIHIHAADPAKETAQFRQSPADRLDGWERELKHLNLQLGVAHRYGVFLWGPKQMGGRDLHDRYILTDQVGISAPGGLDCQPSNWANTSTWSVLDEDDRRARLDEYDPQLSPFKLLDARTIVS